MKIGRFRFQWLMVMPATFFYRMGWKILRIGRLAVWVD